jgi:2-dehydro-3-deoxygalactonokinase
MTDIATILADWGTTNLRAVALDGGGTIVDSCDVPLGLRRMGDRAFADVFDETLGDWRSGGTVPVLLSGMVGSRQGWIEAPYCPCPVTAADLAGCLTAVPERENTWIVPGVCLGPDDSKHDVMRGEEVQVFGALDITGRDSARLCLPGTHSKWVRADAGAIMRFATAMTGEVFAVLTDHSILGAMMTDGAAFSEQAFRDGLDRSGETGGLLHHLFTVRADGLFDALAPDRARDFLSGVLIGHEVRDLSLQFKMENEETVLVCSGALGRCYETAFEHFGLPSRTVSVEEATLRGQALIWEMA